MKLVVLGSEGCDPGPLARRLADDEGVPLLSGDAAEVADNLRQQGEAAGFVLCGWPATEEQVGELESVLGSRDLGLDAVLRVEADRLYHRGVTAAGDRVADFYDDNGLLRRLRGDAGDALLHTAARRVLRDLERAMNPHAEAEFPPPPQEEPEPPSAQKAEPATAVSRAAPEQAAHAAPRSGSSWKQAAAGKGRIKRSSRLGGAKKGWKPK